MRPLARVAVAAVAVVVAAVVVGWWLGDAEERRVGLPPPDETVATLLDDGTPVFVTRRTDESVTVLDARTPRRDRPGGLPPADLLDGLVAWCAGQGFVDPLDPAATFAPDGRATGATSEGLGVYEVTTRERAHVLVRDRTPTGRAADDAGGCDDPDGAEHHGHAMRDVDLDAVPTGPSWVVEAAVDLAAGKACAPADDALAWPLCPDGGVDVDVADRVPGDELATEHGRDYASRAAFGFVGRFLVVRDDDGPLTQVWRLPGEVELRAKPLQLDAEATLTVRDDGSSPAVEVRAVEGADLPDTVGTGPSTTVVVDDEQAVGADGVELVRRTVRDEPGRRWRLTLRRDPLATPVRLERAEALGR